jgi:hypothetical protein
VHLCGRYKGLCLPIDKLTPLHKSPTALTSWSSAHLQERVFCKAERNECLQERNECLQERKAAPRD